MKPGRQKALARDIRFPKENIPGRVEFVQPTENCYKTEVEKEVHGHTGSSSREGRKERGVQNTTQISVPTVANEPALRSRPQSPRPRSTTSRHKPPIQSRPPYRPAVFHDQPPRARRSDQKAEGRSTSNDTRKNPMRDLRRKTTQPNQTLLLEPAASSIPQGSERSTTLSLPRGARARALRSVTYATSLVLDA